MATSPASSTPRASPPAKHQSKRSSPSTSTAPPSSSKSSATSSPPAALVSSSPRSQVTASARSPPSRTRRSPPLRPTSCSRSPSCRATGSPTPSTPTSSPSAATPSESWPKPSGGPSEAPASTPSAPASSSPRSPWTSSPVRAARATAACSNKARPDAPAPPTRSPPSPLSSWAPTAHGSPAATSSWTAASPPPTSTATLPPHDQRARTTEPKGNTMTAPTTITLNNGVEMPALGLGVFQTPPDETRDAVTAALSSGYRLIDTAAAYGNERQVGDAVRSSGVNRSEVFLETKIWISDYGYEQTVHAFAKSAGKLGVDQIDLLILHQALPSAFDKTLDAYRALETLLADGKVRAIGVSNFMVEHLTRLLEVATVIPAANQIEVHPYFQQRQVQAFAAHHDIATQAWAPIGGITFYRDSAHTSTLADPVIGATANKHGKSPA